VNSVPAGTIAASLPTGRYRSCSALGGTQRLVWAPSRPCGGCFRKLERLQLDAHADLRIHQEPRSATPHVARRISGICPLVEAGIRSMSAEEAEFLKTIAEEPIRPDFIRENRSLVRDDLAGDLQGDLDLTVDLDVPRSLRQPATGRRSRAGLLVGLIRLVPRVSETQRIRGIRCRGACTDPG